MPLNSYQLKWNSIPIAVKRFIVRAVIIFVAWKVLYLVFLLPSRVLDKPISHSVASASSWVLNTLTHSNNYSSKSEKGNILTDDGLILMPLDNIYFHQKNVVSIEDPCNGLELFVLYAGFIICMPAALRRKIFFILGGIVLIYIVNVLRCAGITYIILYYPAHANFAHHYIFTFIVYGFIIGLWLLFTNKLNISDAEAN